MGIESMTFCILVRHSNHWATAIFMVKEVIYVLGSLWHASCILLGSAMNLKKVGKYDLAWNESHGSPVVRQLMCRRKMIRIQYRYSWRMWLHLILKYFLMVGILEQLKIFLESGNCLSKNVSHNRAKELVRKMYKAQLFKTCISVNALYCKQWIHKNFVHKILKLYVTNCYYSELVITIRKLITMDSFLLSVNI